MQIGDKIKAKGGSGKHIYVITDIYKTHKLYVHTPKDHPIFDFRSLADNQEAWGKPLADFQESFDKDWTIVESVNPNLTRLLEQGLDCTRFRGHHMELTRVTDKIMHLACAKCGKGLWLDHEPAPNSIEISGDAVALACD